MASANKNGGKTSKAKKQVSKGSFKDTAAGFLDEVEKHGSALAGEVKELFDTLTEKVSNLASAAAETTAAAVEKVTVKEPSELLRSLLEDVKDAGEASINSIGKRFDELRSHAEKSAAAANDTKPAKKKAKKKKTTSKKAAPKKTIKKKVAKKKASTKKTVKKKVAKKKTTGKKAAPKKTTKRKVVKKTATKKKAAKKKATRKK